MTPTIVISKPDAHQERIVISDFDAPTAKCATIFYTTNSTTPTHNGATPTGTTLVYTGPVTVGKCNEIFFEALAYKSGLADSNVTTYDAIFGGTTCGSAPLVSDSAALSGAGETGNTSTSSRSRGRGRRDDASSDYRLVAYTEGTSSAFARSKGHPLMS